MEYNWSEPSTSKRVKRRRPLQRVTLHQPQDIGYLFANSKYYTVINDNSMVSYLPPWYMILGPGTITAFKTIRALLRCKIPMETDFSTIYRLIRTVSASVTFDEVIDAMIVFFGPPRQTFEEFLLGFALRKWDKNAEKRFSRRECIFYSAITFFTTEAFEHKLTNPIPPLTIKQIPPVLYWVLNQSVKNPPDMVEAFTRLLLAAKSPYVSSLPNSSLISFIKLDLATRKFDWCDCKKKAVKYDYLHTKNAHKDYIWLTDEGPYLPQIKFIEKQRSFLKVLQRAKERLMIPFSHPKPSLFRREGRIVDLSNTPDYSPLVQKAKRIYENNLNKKFERSAVDFWNKYYKGRVDKNIEGRLFEVFKSYHRTQLCPRKWDEIKDVYTTSRFKSMADCYEYGEVFETPQICSHFSYHPFSDYCSSVDTQFTCIEHHNKCPDLEHCSVQDCFDKFTDEQENTDIVDDIRNKGNDKGNDNKEPVNDTNNEGNDNKEPVNEKGNDSVDGSIVTDKKDIDPDNI